MMRTLRILPLIVVAAATVCFAGSWPEETVIAQAVKKGERKMKPKHAIVWPAADIKWDDDTLVKGGKMAVLWGDPAKTAYGALARWPGGADAYQPLHSHPYDAKLVILSGTLVVSLEGKPVQELGPNSYWFLPGRMNHSTSCKAGEDCVFFITMSGRDATKWVGEKSKR